MYKGSEVGEDLWKNEKERISGVEGGEEVVGPVISGGVETSHVMPAGPLQGRGRADGGGTCQGSSEQGSDVNGHIF